MQIRGLRGSAHHSPLTLAAASEAAHSARQRLWAHNCPLRFQPRLLQSEGLLQVLGLPTRIVAIPRSFLQIRSLLSRPPLEHPHHQPAAPAGCDQHRQRVSPEQEGTGFGVLRATGGWSCSAVSRGGLGLEGRREPESPLGVLGAEPCLVLVSSVHPPTLLKRCSHWRGRAVLGYLWRRRWESL